MHNSALHHNKQKGSLVKVLQHTHITYSNMLARSVLYNTLLVLLAIVALSGVGK